MDAGELVIPPWMRASDVEYTEPMDEDIESQEEEAEEVDITEGPAGYQLLNRISNTPLDLPRRTEEAQARLRRAEQDLEELRLFELYFHDPNLHVWQEKTWVFYTDASILKGVSGQPGGIAVAWCAPENGQWCGRIATREFANETNALEMAAIKMCLTLLDQMILDDSWIPENVMIWTDSLRCVQQISKLRRVARRQELLDGLGDNELVEPDYRGHSEIFGDDYVHRHMRDLRRRGVTVHVKWCRGHSTTLGNHVADRGAGLASRELLTSSQPFNVSRYWATKIEQLIEDEEVLEYRVTGYQIERIPLLQALVSLA